MQISKGFAEENKIYSISLEFSKNDCSLQNYIVY